MEELNTLFYLKLFTSDGIGTQFIRRDNPNNGIDLAKIIKRIRKIYYEFYRNKRK